MRTVNHVNSPAMLKVNDGLGYVALPHFIMLRISRFLGHRFHGKWATDFTDKEPLVSR
jgi:hypothetical protein